MKMHKSPSDLIFDPVEHRYTLNGKRIPGVNDILEKVGIKKPYAGDPYYGEVGIAAALAIQYDVEGKLDESSVAEDIRPRLDAWRKFVKEKGYKPMACEVPLHADTYAGTFDHLGIIDGKIVLLDIKCTEKVDDYGTTCQLAGYWNLIKRNLNQPPAKVGALRLGKDGEYELRPYDSPFPGDLWEWVWGLYQVKTRAFES